MVDRFKAGQIAGVNKRYRRNFKDAEIAMELDPKNPRVIAQVKDLKKRYQSDIDKIMSMTYIDVQNARREISNNTASGKASNEVSPIIKAGIETVSQLMRYL